MRASLLFFLAVGLTLAACAGDDRPAGPRDAALPVDLGPVDAGTLCTDGSATVIVDFGPPQVCTFDAGMDLGGPLCAFDASVPDLGAPSDLGPFAPPDLGTAPCGPAPVSPSFPDMGPDYIIGCPKLEYCLAPPDAGLTWDNFGRDFFATYCTRCHSTMRSGPARGSAPDCRNWDDRDSVNAYLPLIRRYVGEIMYMPYDEPWVLPCERRQQLVTWIDEGAP